MGEKESKFNSDDELTQCQHCKIQFGPFTRKHQCQLCSHVACDTCCPSRNGERICNLCFAQCDQLLQLTRNVVHERERILIETAPPNFMNHNILRSITNVKNTVEKISYLPLETARFVSSLAIAATRSWEAFRRDPLSNEPCFPKISPFTIEMTLQEGNLRVGYCSFNLNIIKIKPLVHNELIHQVKAKIIEQFGVVQEIVPQISLEDLKVFLEEVQFFTFDVGISLNGLSSCDGHGVYLWELLLKNLELARKTLEHELMHSITRWDDWRKDQWDPRKISPEKNPLLKSEKGVMIEAGDFYEERVYGVKSMNESPFCLKIPKWRGYY